MNTLIAQSRDSQRTCLGLDATDMGRPIYKKLGFVDVCPINRWIRPPGITAVRPHEVVNPTVEVRRFTAEDWGALITLDCKAVGVERWEMLKLMTLEKDIDWQVAIENGEMLGYGMSRCGRTARFIGPLVASSSRIAGQLLETILEEGQTDQPWIIDAFDRPDWHETLASHGFYVSRRLTRMAFPLDAWSPALTMTSALVYSGAGFELG